jgi:hypothetical protein
MNPSFLAAMFVSRQVYEALDGHLNNLDPINNKIVEAVDAYYKRDHSAQYVDFDIIESLICSQIDSAKQRDEIKMTLTVLRNLAPDVSDINVRAVARSWKLEGIGKQIVEQLASSRRGDVSSLMEQYLNYTVDEEKDVRPTFEDIFDELEDPTTLMQIGPPQFNAFLDGGLRAGDHAAIVGRPNSGKSLTAIDISCRLAQQGKVGLYLENEDRLLRTTRRFWSNLTGLTKEDILTNKQHAQMLAKREGIDNIIIRDIAPGTLGQITSLVRQFRPDYVVVNQVRNLAIGQASGMTEKLERAGIGMRNLAKRENVLAISVTQAGDQASNKRILEQNDVDSSKTGFCATLDLMIGVGVDDSLEKDDKRCLSTPKCKVGIGGSCIVSIDKNLSRIA